MYDLFAFKKLLALPKDKNGKCSKIVSSAYVETDYWSICALACSNGYIVLYYQESDEYARPVIRQIPWLHHPHKEIKSISFDPVYKCWLAVVTEDTSLYIVPALTILNPCARVEGFWNISDVTQHSMPHRKSPPTAVVWWRTIEDEPIAIIGHELGEITFVDLKQLQEIGGTFIPVAVLSLQLVQNDKKNKTFLLITGVTETQWLLLLEDRSTLFFWPGEADFFSGQSSGYEDRSANICGSQASDVVTSFVLQPQKIVKYEGVSRLVPQYMSSITVLSVLPSNPRQLLIHDWSLKDTPVAEYDVPSNCQQLLFTDKIIFTLESIENAKKLTVISRKLSEVINSDEKIVKPEGMPCLQNFMISDTSQIVSIHKVRNNKTYFDNESFSDSVSTVCSRNSVNRKELSSNKRRNPPIYNDRQAGYSYNLKNFPSTNSNSAKSQSSCHSSQSSSYDSVSDYTEASETSYCNTCSLDGCLIISQYGLYICKQRIMPEDIILSLLTSGKGQNSNNEEVPNLERVENLGRALSIDIRHLYERAADDHLMAGKFTEALKLLQLSQCPQLKRVATFASQGCLAELLTYIRMLFSSNIIDIAAPDRRHFANLIIHCFVHQLLGSQMNRKKLQKSFWKFLDLNSFYDDDVALRLLSDHGLYDSLYHLVKIHGLYHKLLESLVSSSNSYCCYNSETREAIQILGCQSVFSKYNNESFLMCVSMKEVGHILLMNPRLVSCYASLVQEILPKLLDVNIIIRFARVLDFTDHYSKLFLHKVSAKYWQRYQSISSLTPTASEAFDFVSTPSNDLNIEDIAETFVLCLLKLNQLCNSYHHNFDLINAINIAPASNESTPDDHSDQLFCKPTVLSCGAAHAALIRNGCLYTWGKTKNGRLGHNIAPAKTEKMLPKMIGLLLKHRVTVRSVSCGSHHTLAITSHGVYSWGSSNYGQLGQGELLRSTQPMMISDFLLETVISVVCGQYHSLALSADGRLYSWGWGVHGQLGHGDPNNLCRPKLVDPKFVGGMIVQMSAGHSHTVVLNGKGDLFTFGCGLFGQLGKKTVNKETSPCKISLPEPVSQVASGFFHSIALTCSNKLYTWGMNPQSLRLQAQMIKKMRVQKNQFRHQPTLKEIASAEKDLNQSHLVPMLLDTSLIDAKIKYITCGGAHTALLTASGEVFTWGRNIDGQLGIGSRKEMRTPTMLMSINDRRMVEISCGTDYTIALDSTGKLWGWGRNDLGQLGIELPESLLGLRSTQMPTKIVRIKSTKRMIHLKQSRNTEILKPVELSWLPASIDNAPKFFESLEDDHLAAKVPIMEVPVLYDLECPPYQIKTLHIALQSLYVYYNSSSVMHHCLSYQNFQAAAKICLLEGAYHKAIVYQLNSIESIGEVDNLTETVCAIIELYVSQIDVKNVQNIKSFLEHILKFWIKNSLSIEKLESLLTSHCTNLFPALAITLFTSKDEEGNDLSTDAITGQNQNSIIKMFSTQFCLSVASYVIEQTESGSITVEHIQHLIGTMAYKLLCNHKAMMKTSWGTTLTSHNLWQVILRNLSKNHENAIVLPSSAVEALNRSLIAENSPITVGINANEYVDGSFVAFTCGHHYTTHQYRTSVIPNFEQSLHKLPISISKTAEILLSMYETEGMCPGACPRCALVSLQQEFS